jgi:AbrB family looped-hinge helix DNA binding protein
MVTTTLSSKGQVVLPRSVREARGLREGAKFEVIDAGEDIVLRQIGKQRVDFPPTTKDDLLAARIKYDGPPVSIEDMDRAVQEEAKRRWNAKNR